MTALAVLGEGDSLSARALAALVGGVVTSLVGCPFDVIKTRLMNQGGGLDSPYRGGVLGCAAAIIQTEGPLALWKGLLPVYCRQVRHSLPRPSKNTRESARLPPGRGLTPVRGLWLCERRETAPPPLAGMHAGALQPAQLPHHGEAPGLVPRQVQLLLNLRCKSAPPRPGRCAGGGAGGASERARGLTHYNTHYMPYTIPYTLYISIRSDMCFVSVSVCDV